uniref:Uncharacterized protein n=1 Tax=Kalanchoe fedtschenkoi TaxID=63787 RepID=A0A7N0T359_KALFE
MMEMIKSMAFSFTSVSPPTPPRTPNSNYTSSPFLLNHNLTAPPPPPNKSKQLSSCIFLVSTPSSSFRSPAEKTPSQGSTEGQEIATEEEDTPRPSFSRSSSSSARIQIDLLDQLTGSTADDGYENAEKQTIRQQLANLVGDRDDDFTIPLGKNLKKVSAAFLTISQKRNIKRQAYLTEVSQRNDSVFFATIGAFILLPPFIILGIAIATSYVQLFP